MKPFKAGLSLANWFLRIGTVGFIALYHLETVTHFKLDSIDFYIALLLVSFAVLLLVGGIMSKQALTVIAGLGIGIIYTYFTITAFSGSINPALMSKFILLSLGFYFFAKGN